MKAVFFVVFRAVVGRLILLVDFVTRPKKARRDEKAQDLIDQQAKSLSLYQFHMCPFCVKTRRVLRELNIPVITRDAKNDTKYRQELLQEGGKFKVPCLRIEENSQTTWMYDSKEIISYLRQRFDLKGV